ncbi:phospho-N-acetylmuramoyl-pentapeptide-transferase [Aedoeadaptatus nemausensis]|uniref:Phospho-N-acetylmuramoyl-pentapeptide-transferase n=1 Tax=Aedoeadaptatus nemausensis TaxID=2582829 RepID=A0A6V6XZ45_9FIRM|nr:phospho-N-acetylmuramoyl-pentapeptide-transferase [Peptoniphilus nemausensis]CAC9924582.1 phospho-N-acetylmuramoyl-pentapeptide-transferase [Peptoniphilus nemausensis]
MFTTLPISFGLGLIFSLIGGHYFIPMLRRLHAGQEIREDGPQSHLVKAGTPTIGGIIFLTSAILATLVIKNLTYEAMVLFISTLGFGLVGFVDDYLKVVHKRNLGFTARQKLLAQILIAVLLYVLIRTSDGLSTAMLVPGRGTTWEMGIMFIPFIIFVVVGTVNSVNLTDGLDGLSSSVTIIVMLFFSLVSYKMGRTSITLFCLVMAGALLGFLFYNKYPAKVFMGDTGSLALGGAVVAVAILLNLPLLLPICCGIYFIETLSVIIQVVSFKTRGKRVFLMSPIHHHFEHKGMNEVQIVGLFSIVEIVLCVISYFLIF